MVALVNPYGKFSVIVLEFVFPTGVTFAQIPLKLQMYEVALVMGAMVYVYEFPEGLEQNEPFPDI